MTATYATDATALPAQRTGTDTALPPQKKYAATLMRRLWACDMDVAEELVAALDGLTRPQLGRVIDNLMWTLANQPRPITAALDRHIRMLWQAKMSKPLDATAEAKLVSMQYEEAERWVHRLQALPDRPKAA
jgi:hypothetical protein